MENLFTRGDEEVHQELFLDPMFPPETEPWDGEDLDEYEEDYESERL